MYRFEIKSLCFFLIYGSLFKNKPPTNSLLAQIQIRQSVKDMYLYFLLPAPTDILFDSRSFMLDDRVVAFHQRLEARAFLAFAVFSPFTLVSDVLVEA